MHTIRGDLSVVACLVLCVVSVSIAHAGQTAAEAAAPDLSHQGGVTDGVFDAVGSVAVHLSSDFHEQLTYPFGLASRNPTRFVLGSAGILALIVSDRVTYGPVSNPSFLPEGSMDETAQALSNIGNAQNAIPLVLGFGAIGLVTGSRREKQTSIMLAEALVTSGVWTNVLKYVSGRERPRELHEPVSDWTGPGGVFNDDGTGGGHASFPSGHATGIWAAATVLAHQYPTGGVVPVAVYGFATAVSYSRMVVGAHFLSDIVVGGLIGYGCARQVIGAHARDDIPSRMHFLYEPEGDEQRIGLSVDF